MALSTGWKKVAQSGATMDGREIQAQWLLDAAESYSTDVYTAPVFPNHNEWYGSYGTVKALKAETDKNGVVSLYADIQPNAYWQSDVRYGQKLFTSVALMPNFAKTGKWYMTHLAAVDNPASLGVEKLEFSAKKPEILLSAVFDTSQTNTNETEDDVALFAKLYRKLFPTKPTESTDMTKEQAEQFQAQLDALSKKVETFATTTPKPDATQNDDLVQLKQENEQLKKDLAEFKAKDEARTQEFNALKDDFKQLSDTLSAALQELPSTQNHSSTGGVDDKKDKNADYY